MKISAGDRLRVLQQTAPSKAEPGLDDLNRTELLALARRNELPGVSDGVPVAVLLELLPTLSPIEAKDPMNAIRTKLSSWLKRYWDVLQMQVPKKVCPECHLCPDVQVAWCYIKNKDQIT